MKKLIALLLALIMVLSMAACSDSEDPQGTTEPTAAPTNPTDPTKPPLKLEDIVPGEGYLTKVSYTATDDELLAAKDVIVATCGDASLDNATLQVYYWMGVYDFLNQYGAYAAYFGMDYTQPLDKQVCEDVEGTWQHYFLSGGINRWHSYQAMALMAKKENVPMDPEFQKILDEQETDLQKDAKDNGFESVDALLEDQLGAGVTFEEYYAYMEVFYLGFSYYEYVLENLNITEADIEAYYTENEAALKENGYSKDDGDYYDVRHILIQPEGGTKDDEGNTTWSEAEWAACQQKAQSLLDGWKAGEATEESFAALAEKESMDGGSNTNGGLYENLDKNTNFVQPFKDWYLAPDRAEGDTGLVKTDYGYHIMYFSGTKPIWHTQCKAAIESERTQAVMEEAVKAYPVTVHYDKILLGVVDLTPNNEEE